MRHTFRLFENEASVPFNFEFIKNQIEAKVGGERSNEEAKTSSFQALKNVFDIIPLAYFNEPNNAKLSDLFMMVTDKNKIDFLSDFTENEVNTINLMVTDIEKINGERNEVEFIKRVNQYVQVSERILKINRFLSGQIEKAATNESVKPIFEDLDSDTKNKIDLIIKKSQEGVENGFENLLASQRKKIAATPETAEGSDMLDKFKDILQILGLFASLKGPVEAKEAKMPKEQNQSTKRKKRIITRLIRAVTIAQLPLVNNQVIETHGDYFKLFKSLENQNKAWMDLSLEKYVFDGDSVRIAEFNASARKEESPTEENQINYLKASRSWILSYIKGDKDGSLIDKEETNYVASIENAALEKEKEIKNYYLSREFNLGNFGGIQLKPEIRLPLHTKVKLAVSEEDRKKESPLRNVMSGLGTLVKGAFGAVQDTGNETVAQAARARNVAIFNGINSLIKGGVTLIGGKQAGRDYAEGVNKVATKTGLTNFGFGEKTDDKIKEQAMAMPAAPAAPSTPGQTAQTPGSIPSGMDTFSLLGPGKKKSKKSKKINRIVSYKDFFKSK